MKISEKLILAGRELADELRPLEFSDPVTHTYLTVDYAAEGYEGYLEKFGNSKKRVLMLGMNPGPFGMAQTGVPFGEIAMVRDWMGLKPKIGKPEKEHPKRKVLGMDCPKSEVSGRRLWGCFSEKFPVAKDFFKDHLAINFCPLIWMKDTGANLTPDKIRAAEMAPVDAACQKHLRKLIEVLEPEYLIGVGAYAEKRMEEAKAELGCGGVVAKILHPSPASPAANRGWAEAAEKQLKAILGEDHW
ncbi:MAG: single-stranded DNA-binding protein [Akkermansiaceae bacterium]|jgi:single-strand selective monofunctional uracil DNA glycosylase|nr:single-stranded DNA-binding protein [Akkermansiaceae bacterium]MDP4646602.1 single-stranded DNA-binding protein [Akkermansiaceae bacterium]MDP4720199.1 single-stranded DNA-binding protein [Akkermansiaceae bacterium]MDP4779811.1 single-stranded DNA-binding protein [Akkermansiaceae bacterium]MDP4846401.1 single-stranded DNA-binding protein [Akkermansiaceae bacterium]